MAELDTGAEVVVLLHARPFVRWYQPLIALLGNRPTVCWRHVAPPPGLSIAVDAANCVEHLEELGVHRPHLVGHSYGGVVALEVARRMDVRSLALLEPSTAGLADPEEATRNFAPLTALVRTAGPDAAMRVFLTAVCGEDATGLLDRLVPDATADALWGAADFFDVELPALLANRITADDVVGIDAPVLNLLGEASAPRFAESAAIVQAWFPHAIRRDVPGATHLMMAQQPDAVAGMLEAFWASIPTGPTS